MEGVLFAGEFLCTKQGVLNSPHALKNNFLIYFPNNIMLHQSVYQFRYESAKNGKQGVKKIVYFSITERDFVFIGNMVIFLSLPPLGNYKHILRIGL